MNHALLIPRRRSGFSPLNFGSDLALWLDPSYGVYTDRSTQLTAASSQYWSVASNSSLQSGDIDSWIAGWVYFDSVPASIRQLFGKNGECQIRILPDNTFQFTDNATISVTFPSVTATTGTWYFVMGYHDSVNNTVNVSVNGAAFVSAADGGAMAAWTDIFFVGDNGGGQFVDGRVDSVMYGKNPVGGIAALATTIRDFLYNSGAGRVYADLSAAQATAWGLVSAFDFDGDGLDAHGSNDLTAVNSPTYTSGIASGVAGDGDVVSLIVPRVGPNITPPSYAARPTWVANAGQPYLQFDGTDDYLVAAGIDLSPAMTVICAAWLDSVSDFPMVLSYGMTSHELRYLSTTRRPDMTSEFNSAISSDAQALSAWHVLSGQENATDLAVRLNGVEKALTASDAAIAASTLTIAARQGGSLFLPGRIAGVLAIKGYRTPAECLAAERFLGAQVGVVI